MKYEIINGKLIDCIPDTPDIYLSQTKPRVRVVTQELDLLVPEGVNKIDRSAFDRVSLYLESLELPDSVKILYAGQFKRLQALEELRIGNGVTSIPAGMISDNCAIKKVIIPGSVKIIQPSAFRNCLNLETVIIEGNGLEEIKCHAFMECKKLKEINFPSSLRKIEEQAFCGSGLEEIFFDHDVDFQWGWYGAFALSKLKKMVQIHDDRTKTIMLWDGDCNLISEETIPCEIDS